LGALLRRRSSGLAERPH